MPRANLDPDLDLIFGYYPDALESPSVDIYSSVRERQLGTAHYADVFKGYTWSYTIDDGYYIVVQLPGQYYIKGAYQKTNVSYLTDTFFGLLPGSYTIYKNT